MDGQAIIEENERRKIEPLIKEKQRLEELCKDHQVPPSLCSLATY
jgi:hypothetical protein